MEIEYNLTTRDLFQANLILSFYRLLRPLLIFITIFVVYAFISQGSIFGLLIGVFFGLITGVLFTVALSLIMASRNKHYAGKRTLMINNDGYQYIGNSFKRESNWCEKKKILFTRWYFILDTTSLYPVVIDRDVLSDANISEIQSIFMNKTTEPRH